MACPKVTSNNLAHSAGRTSNEDAYSIAEFCERHRISVQLFYKFRTEMPATFRVGTRVLISRESASKWRREREAAANGPSLKK